MRKTLTAAALAAGVALALLPAAPASAYCDMRLYKLTGRCNLCEIINPSGPCPD